MGVRLLQFLHMGVHMNQGIIVILVFVGWIALAIYTHHIRRVNRALKKAYDKLEGDVDEFIIWRSEIEEWRHWRKSRQ